MVDKTKVNLSDGSNTSSKLLKLLPLQRFVNFFSNLDDCIKFALKSPHTLKKRWQRVKTSHKHF